MKLFDYFRSSASYRVRIALQLKNLNAQYSEIHLVNSGGEQHLPAYSNINPQQLVPTLEDNDHYFSQSLAIIEYLDEQYSGVALLPSDPFKRAHTRSLAQIISSDIHPLNNLRVLQYLKQHFNANEKDIEQWYQHWIEEGFRAFEQQLSKLQDTPNFCIGNDVSLADICLIPQVYNAKRFKVDVSAYPRIEKINNYCLKLPAFIKAGPGYVSKD